MSGIHLDGFLPLLFIAIVAFFIVAAIFQWLWNITVPEAFGLETIRYWIAFRLLLIAAILASGGVTLSHGA